VAQNSVAAERSRLARTPPKDPVPEGLRAEPLADVLARLEALAAQIAAQQAADARGQPTQPRPPPDSAVRVYTVRETAELLRLGLSKTYADIVAGRIPAIKLGGTWLVPHEGLVRLLKGNT
jgi:excisionase family DNA binding protein